MIAVFDIDGVLADASHRQHFVESRPKDWDAFFAAVGDDAVIERGVALLREYQQRDRIVLLSGRPERTRADTQAWLERNGIVVERLVLRGDRDFRSAGVAKAALVHGIGDPAEVSIVVDDDENVVESLTALGYAARVFR